MRRRRSASTLLSLPDHWLCATFRAGDEFYVFGFSRGAFSARSFVSMVC